ncbi:MAG: hypothetical protein K9N11_04520 [Lentisphaeria bacterium]|nr:hypothetical protein [Candidatus Neomarinimicrobiota bacterium]MCF7842098.1 hypothetical protein [Lentisphaeria bacterium]
MSHQSANNQGANFQDPAWVVNTRPGCFFLKKSAKRATFLHGITTAFLLALTGVLFTPEQAMGQNRYAPGIFYTYPSGKYVYHIHVSTWHAYFATNDGVLIYNYTQDEWEDPISLSNGLPQIPAMYVYGDDEQQLVWVVSPNFVTRYRLYSEWANSSRLPPQLIGKELHVGITPKGFAVGNDQGQTALFDGTTGDFSYWITDSAEVRSIRYANKMPASIQSVHQLPLFSMPGQAQFTASGEIETDYFRTFRVTTVGEGPASQVFVGTNGGGIYQGNLRTQYLEPLYTGLLEPGVMSLNTTPEGVVTVGGMMGLTTISNLDQFTYFRAATEPGLSPGPTYISTILSAGKEFVIGARGGVLKLDPVKKNWTQVVSATNLEGRRIYDIARHQRLLAIATGQNLYLKWGNAPLTTLFQEPDGIPIYTLHFHNDTLWMGTLYGLYLYDVNSETLLTSDSNILQNGPAPGASTPVYELYAHGDEIWMATNRGMARYNTRVGDWAVFQSPVEYLTPRGLVVDSSGVWVGTEQGLRFLNPESGLWAVFTVSDGLASNFITDLATTADYIWAGTDRGLTRIYRKGLRLP